MKCFLGSVYKTSFWDKNSFWAKTFRINFLAQIFGTFLPKNIYVYLGVLDNNLGFYVIYSKAVIIDLNFTKIGFIC
jgi:hypothetical protein